MWVSLLSSGFSLVGVYSSLREVPELDAASQLGTYWNRRQQERCFMVLWTTLLFVIFAFFSQQHDNVDVHLLNFWSTVTPWPSSTKPRVILILYFCRWLFLLQSGLLCVLLLDYTLFFQTISPLCSAHPDPSPLFQHTCSLSHAADTFTFMLPTMQVIWENTESPSPGQSPPCVLSAKTWAGFSRRR